MYDDFSRDILGEFPRKYEEEENCHNHSSRVQHIQGMFQLMSIVDVLNMLIFNDNVIYIQKTKYY